MPINHRNHYYYMEAYKGEEGEIMLHNKRHNGILIAELIEKKYTDEFNILNNVNIFPNNNKKDEFLNNIDYLQFNEYSQKLSFNFSQTNKCVKGCYLLINYYCPDFGMDNIEGSEYTLLSRVWDEKEYKSQIVFIPLNEYIFGTFEKYSINIGHHYSLYIPEDNDLIIEIQGSNIKALTQIGILKINILNYNEKYIDLMQQQNEKIIFKLSKDDFKLKTFKNEYISFIFVYYSLYSDYYSEYFFSKYYFRILQQNTNKDYIIYPLDTNKANICQTSEFPKNNNYECFFLLKNDYKEFNYYSYIYSYGITEVNYNAYLVNQTDYYSIDIDKIRKLKKIQQRKGFLYLYPKKENYILVEIKSNYKEILTINFNFNAEMILSPPIDIFSYQAFYLSKYKRSDIYINFNLFKEYKIFIQSIRGGGYICLEENCDNENKILTSRGMSLSITVSEKNKNFYLGLYQHNYLLVNIKISNHISNDVMDEINYGYEIKNNNKENKIISYYIKDIYNQGIDINFFFNFENENDIKNIYILGHIIDYEEIKSITTKNELLNYLANEEFIIGSFDFYSKNGLIVFDKEKPKNKTSIRDLKDKYYLITIFNVSD